MLLQLDHISKSYPSADGQSAIPVLQDINLTMNQGDALAILGPSGSGKSTLLNIIGAMDRPSFGHVYYYSRDITQMDDDSLAAFRNQSVGFFFQSHYLLPQSTVLENVMLANFC